MGRLHCIWRRGMHARALTMPRATSGKALHCRSLPLYPLPSSLLPPQDRGFLAVLASELQAQIDLLQRARLEQAEGQLVQVSPSPSSLLTVRVLGPGWSCMVGGAKCGAGGGADVGPGRQMGTSYTSTAPPTRHWASCVISVRAPICGPYTYGAAAAGVGTR